MTPHLMKKTHDLVSQKLGRRTREAFVILGKLTRPTGTNPHIDHKTKLKGKLTNHTECPHAYNQVA
jgi:hypothetical protein